MRAHYHLADNQNQNKTKYHIRLIFGMIYAYNDDFLIGAMLQYSSVLLMIWFEWNWQICHSWSSEYDDLYVYVMVWKNSIWSGDKLLNVRYLPQKINHFRFQMMWKHCCPEYSIFRVIIVNASGMCANFAKLLFINILIINYKSSYSKIGQLI